DFHVTGVQTCALPIWPRHTLIADYRRGATTPARRHVLIFGGGYDTRQDGYGARAPDSVGNAVFILDALTGEVLWWTGGVRGAGEIGRASCRDRVDVVG